MVTHLEWSDTIGKRVRSGDWADQAISTVVKIEEELQAAGDDFGLAANRRENAAQLVDYFMEEAKVVYVIYKVWTAGFKDWLIEQGVTQADMDAEVERLKRLMAYPDGTPLDPEPRWEALGLRAGRLANGIRSYDLTVADAMAELDGVRERLADAPRPVGRPDGRDPRLRREAVRRGRARDLLPGDHGAVPPGAVHAVRRPRHAVRGDARPQPVHQPRGDARSPGRTGSARGHRADRGRGSLGHPLRPVRVGRAHPARRPRGGHRLAGPGALRVRRDRGAPVLDLGRDRRLPLLRPLQPGPLDDPRRALGSPGPNGRSAPLAWGGRPDDDAQVPVERVEVARGHPRARVRAHRPDQAATPRHPAGG